MVLIPDAAFYLALGAFGAPVGVFLYQAVLNAIELQEASGEAAEQDIEQN